MNRALPENPSLEARAGALLPERLLGMDENHYLTRVWPLMFYISRGDMGKWQMNAARSLGNLGERGHVPLLVRSLSENPDEKVRGMCAWALGRLGGPQARQALESRRRVEEGPVRGEIASALEML